MHVIPKVDEVPVEIQVRTKLQHQWALVSERFADKWGRALIYGGAPDEPNSLEWLGDLALSRTQWVWLLREIAVFLRLFERFPGTLASGTFRFHDSDEDIRFLDLLGSMARERPGQ